MQFSQDRKCWCLKCTSNHESDIIEHTGSLRTASQFIFLPSTGELRLSKRQRWLDLNQLGGQNGQLVKAVQQNPKDLSYDVETENTIWHPPSSTGRVFQDAQRRLNPVCAN